MYVEIEIPRRGDENVVTIVLVTIGTLVEIEIPRRGDENTFCNLFIYTTSV